MAEQKKQTARPLFPELHPLADIVRRMNEGPPVHFESVDGKRVACLSSPDAHLYSPGLINHFKVEGDQLDRAIEQMRCLGDIILGPGPAVDESDGEAFCRAWAQTAMAVWRLISELRGDLHGIRFYLAALNPEGEEIELLRLVRDVNERWARTVGPDSWQMHEHEKDRVIDRFLRALEMLWISQDKRSRSGGRMNGGYSPNDLAGELLCSADRIRDYAKAAGVKRPRSAQNDFRYPVEDAVKIAKHAADGPRHSKKIRDAAKKFLDGGLIQGGKRPASAK